MSNTVCHYCKRPFTQAEFIQKKQNQYRRMREAAAKQRHIVNELEYLKPQDFENVKILHERGLSIDEITFELNLTRNQVIQIFIKESRA